MSAILGLDPIKIREVLERVRAITAVASRLANFNSPTQIVISGDYGAVQTAGQAMLDAGAKRVVPLNVSGAWHSELMEPAVGAAGRPPSRRAISLMPEFDVISNVDGRPYRDVETIKAQSYSFGRR